MGAHGNIQLNATLVETIVSILILVLKRLCPRDCLSIPSELKCRRYIAIISLPDAMSKERGTIDTGILVRIFLSVASVELISHLFH